MDSSSASTAPISAGAESQTKRQKRPSEQLSKDKSIASSSTKDRKHHGKHGKDKYKKKEKQKKSESEDSAREEIVFPHQHAGYIIGKAGLTLTETVRQSGVDKIKIKKHATDASLAIAVVVGPKARVRNAVARIQNLLSSRQRLHSCVRIVVAPSSLFTPTSSSPDDLTFRFLPYKAVSHRLNHNRLLMLERVQDPALRAEAIAASPSSALPSPFSSSSPFTPESIRSSLDALQTSSGRKLLLIPQSTLGDALKVIMEDAFAMHKFLDSIKLRMGALTFYDNTQQSARQQQQQQAQQAEAASSSSSAVAAAAATAPLVSFKKAVTLKSLLQNVLDNRMMYSFENIAPQQVCDAFLEMAKAEGASIRSETRFSATLIRRSASILADGTPAPQQQSEGGGGGGGGGGAAAASGGGQQHQPGSVLVNFSLPAELVASSSASSAANSGRFNSSQFHAEVFTTAAESAADVDLLEMGGFSSLRLAVRVIDTNAAPEASEDAEEAQRQEEFERELLEYIQSVTIDVPKHTLVSSLPTSPFALQNFRVVQSHFFTLDEVLSIEVLTVTMEEHGRDMGSKSEIRAEYVPWMTRIEQCKEEGSTAPLDSIDWKSTTNDFLSRWRALFS